MNAHSAVPVQGQLDAYNARDFDGFLQWFSPDLVVRRADGTELLRGRDQLRELYRTRFGDDWVPCVLIARLCTPSWVVDDELLLPPHGEPRRNTVAFGVRHGLIVEAVSLPE